MKTTCFPIALLLWLIAIQSGGRAQCGDGVWIPCEFCGKDAWAAVTHAKMNHDCGVDVIDSSTTQGTVGINGLGTGWLTPIATNCPVRVVGYSFHVTDSEPAFIEPADCVAANASLGWSKVSPPQRYRFGTIASGGVNGPPPADRHRDCLLTGVPDTEVVSRVWTFPNPTVATEFFGLPANWSADASLNVRVYDVRGGEGAQLPDPGLRRDRRLGRPGGERPARSGGGLCGWL